MLHGGARRLRERPHGCRAGRALVLAIAVLVATIVLGAGAALAAPVQKSVASHVQDAARRATAEGYRTGVAVLDLRTGAYSGAAEDSGFFASESVVKVLIATELLLRGKMTGTVAATAYRMITQSDDGAANALYGLAGGDAVVDLVADHYGIPDLGAPPRRAGWWGNTKLTAKGLVALYAAVARDPAVGPWLTDAMAHSTHYGSDGTDQSFGLPAATTGAAVKQGWGMDGDDSPNAVYNSTGYVEKGRYAVAILTDGPPSTYGSPIAATVTAQAQALMPGGRIEDPADDDPVVTGLTVAASGSTVYVTGSASDPDQPTGSLVVEVKEGDELLATAATDATGGFGVSFAAPNGSHTFAVTVPNIGEGTQDTTVTAPMLAVDGDPGGAVTSVAGRGVGKSSGDAEGCQRQERCAGVFSQAGGHVRVTGQA